MSARRAWLGGLLTAGLLTTLAAAASIAASRAYYAVAPYHDDSAHYRLEAAALHRTWGTDGLSPALRQAAITKDGLDLTLRLLVAPGSLPHRFGHLVVGLPLMALFLFLVTRYVATRSGSAWLGAGVAAWMVAFPWIVAARWGLADFWKDSIALWLPGIAVVSLLQSPALTRPGALLGAGLALGALAMARTAVAVYVVPLLAIACVYLVRAQHPRTVRRGVSLRVALWMGLPTAAGAAAVLAWQGPALSAYYLGDGGAYGTPPAVLAYLLRSQAVQLGMLPTLVALIVVRLSWRDQRWRRPELVLTSACVMGLPCVVSITRGYFQGFPAIWAPLLICWLAAAVAHGVAPQDARRWGAALLSMALVLAVAGGALTIGVTQRRAQAMAWKRALYRDALAVLRQAPSRPYVTLFDEVDGPLRNQALFDEGWHLPAPVPASPATATAANVLGALEGPSPASAMLPCEPPHGAAPPALEALESASARATALGVASQVWHSPHWRQTRRWDTPEYGCVGLYEYAPPRATP